MKTRLKGVLPLILAGFIVPTVSFATHYPYSQTEGECQQLGEQLSQLARWNSDYACAGDIEIAAAYVNAARLKISREKYQQGIVSLTAAEEELKAVRADTNRCAYFSAKVEPHIANIITLISELEDQERLSLKHQN